MLDSGLAANSLQSVPYTKLNFDKQPRKHVEATGIFLHLYGRSDEGQSVVVEAECKAGMSVQFLDGTDDPQCDDTFAENVKCEVLGLLDQEQDVNSPEALVWTTVEYKPCFYGFEPSMTDPPLSFRGSVVW